MLFEALEALFVSICYLISGKADEGNEYWRWCIVISPLPQGYGTDESKCLRPLCLLDEKNGMIGLDDSLEEFLPQGRITEAAALQFATEPRQWTR
jgi:hypothetical protein